MTEFTPVSALAGGILIGLAAALLLLANGRIAGISGILDEAIRPKAGEFGWRAAFLVGLLVAAPTISLAGYELRRVSIDAAMPVVLGAGLLVGFGTRLGFRFRCSHGCGHDRLPPDSRAALADGRAPPD